MLPRTTIVKGVHGDFITCAPNDLITQRLFITGMWEENLHTIGKAMLMNINAPTVLDIGANIGAFSVPMAQTIATTGGTLYSFEPQRIVYYQLCGNVVLNRLDNCICLNKAVGAEDGTIDIPETDFSTAQNVGAFSTDAMYRKHQGIEHSIQQHTTPVPLIKLDDFDIDTQVRLIKLDVEGHELDVLKGGQGFLKHHKYPPIMLEIWPMDWFAAERTALLTFIEELGYTIIAIDATNFLIQHPENDVEAEIIKGENGHRTINRVR